MRKLLFFCVMCVVAVTMNAQKCAVLEFRGSASVSVADIDGISEMFMTYFRPSGYTMIERAQIDKVISEQHFQRSNITDNQAVQLGKILNASIVVVGKVSMLGGQYQVDVRTVDVQSGHDIAFEGATFSGDYRINVRSIAAKLAGQIAITPSSTVQAQNTQTTTGTKKRSSVEILYGYLKIFPNELGTFESEPTSVIAQINKQVQNGYNNWRLPTNEELSLLRANNYLGNGQYMTIENAKGIVLLVTDGEDYSTAQKKKDNELRKQLEAQGYIDLGLSSGTWWKAQNEKGLYKDKDVIQKFGQNLPTTDQYGELLEQCQWIWEGGGYKIIGKNGNILYLPASGYESFNSEIEERGTCGYYFTRDAYYFGMGEYDETHKWVVVFKEGYIDYICSGPIEKYPVRLVFNP